MLDTNVCAFWLCIKVAGLNAEPQPKTLTID